MAIDARRDPNVEEMPPVDATTRLVELQRMVGG
jgi:hypothetical protein